MNKYFSFFLVLLISNHLIAMDREFKWLEFPYTNLKDANQKQDPKKLGHQLFIAAADGDYAKVKSLLNKGVPPDIECKSGTPLGIAICRGYKNICELLIAKSSNVNNKDAIESTPLMLAISCRNRDISELLLEHNADINEKNCMGKTALMIAASCGGKYICELLLACNAQIDEEDLSGNTALVYAATFNTKNTCKLLLATIGNSIKQDKQMLIAFLGINKFRRPACQKLIGKDVMLLITQQVFARTKQAQRKLVAQLNKIPSEQLKAELLWCYQNKIDLDQQQDYPKPITIKATLLQDHPESISNFNYSDAYVALFVFLLISLSNILEIVTL